MSIKVEDFAAARVINFYADEKLCSENGVVIADSQADDGDVFVHNLLQIKGVERCLICGNMVSLQYNEISDDVRIFALAEIDDFLASKRVLQPIQYLSDVQTADALADALIRPTLWRDGGNLEIVSMQNGTLKVRFLGHCVGCPYAQNTFQNVVFKTFKKFMPQVENVQLEEKQ